MSGESDYISVLIHRFGKKQFRLTLKRLDTGREIVNGCNHVFITGDDIFVTGDDV